MVPGGTVRAQIKDPDGKLHAARLTGPDEAGTLWACLPARRLPPVDWPSLARESGLMLPATPRVSLLDGNAPIDLWYPGSRT